MKLEFKIKQPTSVVYDYLTDMQKFVSVHPLIFKIENKGENKYIVHEKLRLGFIPFRFAYPAVVQGSADKSTVRIKATVMKMVDIEMHCAIAHHDNRSVVSETISFRTLLPIKPLMASIFKTQHALLFKNIERLVL